LPAQPRGGDLPHFLDRQGWALIHFQEIEDTPRCSRRHTKMLKQILAQRDLPLGGDRERGHGMASGEFTGFASARFEFSTT
jgi:hypothetical protein